MRKHRDVRTFPQPHGDADARMASHLEAGIHAAQGAHLLAPDTVIEHLRGLSEGPAYPGWSVAMEAPPLVVPGRAPPPDVIRNRDLKRSDDAATMRGDPRTL